MTYQQFQKACMDVKHTQGYPETENGKKILPYITGELWKRSGYETYWEWQGRVWGILRKYNII